MSTDKPRTTGTGDSGLASGVRVQLRSRSTGTWLPGYEIVAASPQGYVVRRVSDRTVCRRLFAENEVRVDPIPMARRTWSPGSAA